MLPAVCTCVSIYGMGCGSYLCGGLLVPRCSVNLTGQKETLGVFHLEGRAQLSGTHKVVLHTIAWRSPKHKKRSGNT